MQHSTTIYPENKSFTPVYYGYSMLNRIRGAITYYGQYKSDATKIDSKIWVGGISSSYDKEFLESNNITHIISVLAGYQPQYPENFQYLTVHSLDSPHSNLEPVFNECYEFINQANGNVLIHCMAGRSRSVTIGASYLMQKYNLKLDEAMQRIVTIRPSSNPNEGFIEQLKEFEQSLQDIGNAAIIPPETTHRSPQKPKHKNKSKKPKREHKRSKLHGRKVAQIAKRQNRTFYQ
jgi:hypothetical protein